MDSSSAWGVFPHAEKRVQTGRGYVVRRMESGHVVDQHNYGGVEPVSVFSIKAEAAAEKFAAKLTKDPRDPTARRHSSKHPDWVKSDPDFQQLKVIKSHAGLARFMAELDQEGELARVAGWIHKPGHIPTPFSYSQAVPLFAWGEHYVWIPETSHKVFRVFSVNPRLVRATEEHVWGDPKLPDSRHGTGIGSSSSD